MTQTSACDGGLKNIEMRIQLRQVETLAQKIELHQTLLSKPVQLFAKQSNGVESVTTATWVGHGQEEEEKEQEEVEEREVDLLNLEKYFAFDTNAATEPDVDCRLLSLALLGVFS